jgi:hypothetical protein
MKTTAEMLRALVDSLEALGEDDAPPKWASPMIDMLDRYTKHRLFEFTPKQVAYIHETHEKVFDEPMYLNEFSAGKVPIGEKLRTVVPDVLTKPLPLKPPGRR